LTWLLTTLQQWILFTGTVAVVGCVTWRMLIAPAAALALEGVEGRADLPVVERRVARAGAIASLVLVVGWVLRMVVQVMAFRDPFAPLWDDVSLLLFETFWGTVWMAQGVVVVLLAGALRTVAGRGHPTPTAHTADIVPPPGAGWITTGLLTLALVATLALSGHAMGADSGRALVVTADGLHALAAGCWIGTLGVILAFGGPDVGGPLLFAAQIRSFSPLALLSGGALVAMGVALSWSHLNAVSELATTTYGRLLSAKVALAGVVLALGFRNWQQGLPVVDTADGAAAVRRRGGLEVSLATVVILLTAVLVHSTKP
jgi:copper transport protein